MPDAVKRVAQQVKDGTLSYKEFRKTRGGLDVEQANELQQWLGLQNKINGYSNALKTGQGDIQTYLQALTAATGNQETARVATLLTGEATDKTNNSIKEINSTTREHDGTVKGFNETQTTFNAKMADFKAALGAARIELGNAFLPTMTTLAGVAKNVADVFARHPAVLKDVTLAAGGLSAAWLGIKAINLVDSVLNPTKAALAEVAVAEDAAAVSAGGLKTALLGLAGPIGAGLAFGPQVGKSIEGFLNSSNWLNEHVRNPVRNFFGADSIPDQHARGGGISGRGPKGKDSVLSWLAPGEHVLTSGDVDAMGGQSSVYGFRSALHRQGGGSILGYDNGGAPGPGGYTKDQAASAIIAAAKARGLNPEQTLAALSTGILETNLGSNSMTNVQQNQSGTVVQGLFQQDSGYNKYGNRTDPNSAARGFVDQFIARGGQSMDPYAAAVKVQVGTYGPGYVESFRNQALGYYNRLAGGAAPAPYTGAAGSMPTGTQGNPIYTTHSQETAARADARVKEIQERLGELKPDAEQSTRDRLNDELGFAQQDQARAHDQAAMGGSDYGSSGSGSNKTQSMAQQFSSGLINGALSDLGFGNVLGGKSPLEWPLVKMFTGMLGVGIDAGNLWAANRMEGGAGFGGGVPGLNWGAPGSGESPSGLGDVSSGLGSGQTSTDTTLSNFGRSQGASKGWFDGLATSDLLNIPKQVAAAQGLPTGKGQGTPSWQGMLTGPGFPGAPTAGSPDWNQQMQQQILHGGTPQNVLPPLLGVVPGVPGMPTNGYAPPMPSYTGGPQMSSVGSLPVPVDRGTSYSGGPRCIKITGS